jgi:3D (Asp-Asp-Asp) domain-containing protein
MKKILLFYIVYILNPVIGFSQADSTFNIAAPVNTDSLVKKDLWATQYYVHSFTSSGNIALLDKDNKPLGFYADTCDFCKAALEGTAFVKDSSGKVHVLNYDKIGTKTLVDCRRCKDYKKSKLNVESWGKTLWKISDGFGDGVKNYKLVPFRTIAVNPDYIPYGSVIYIPQVKGVEFTLHDSTKVKHDGYFFAGDTGGAIKQNHIDVFTGVNTDNPFPDFVLSNNKKTFAAYIITDPVIIDQLKTMHEK